TLIMVSAPICRCRGGDDIRNFFRLTPVGVLDPFLMTLEQVLTTPAPYLKQPPLHLVLGLDRAAGHNVADWHFGTQGLGDENRPVTRDRIFFGAHEGHPVLVDPPPQAIEAASKERRLLDQLVPRLATHVAERLFPSRAEFLS